MDKGGRCHELCVVIMNEGFTNSRIREKCDGQFVTRICRSHELCVTSGLSLVHNRMVCVTNWV